MHTLNRGCSYIYTLILSQIRAIINYLDVILHGFVLQIIYTTVFRGVTPLRKDDGFLYSDTETKAEILNDQFYSVYTREDMTSMPEKGQRPYPDMPDIHIGEAGVLKLLNNINSHKATGPDGIPARLLHEYASHIAPALTKIFQISVNTGTIPDEW